MGKQKTIKKLKQSIKPEIIITGKDAKYLFKYKNLLGLIIIAVIGVIIYSNTFNCSFHYDDFGSIVENKKIRNISDLKSWLDLKQNRLVSYYSFALNYHYGKLDVWGYHLVNLIIHIINALLVWVFTYLIFSTPVLKVSRIASHKYLLSFVTGLIFVSHPLATQSVTYIVQRMASMAALFYLLSLVFYLWGRLLEKGPIRQVIFFIISMISAILAMYTKENAFTLPLAFILIEICFFRINVFNINFKDYRILLTILGIITFIILTGAKFTLEIFNPLPPSEGHVYTITPYNYFLTQFSVLVKYIQLLLMPINQMLDYDFPLSNHFFEGRTISSFLCLFTLFVLAIYCFKKNRVLSFGIFWFFLTISIESSIIPIRDVIFEHRTYLPSFGIFLIISSSIVLLFYDKSKILTYIIFMLIVGSNSISTYQRNKVWKDELSLWSDNVIKAPNLARPITNRGFAYRNLGQWDKAIEDYSRALEINPNYIVALSNRGVAYSHFREFDKAINDYSRAIQIEPNFSDAYSNRGAAYISLNEWNKAIEDFSKAIQINPNYANAFYNRGIAYWNLNKFDEAIRDYSRAIEINPKYEKAIHNRGMAYAGLKEWSKAVIDFTSAIEISPNFVNAYYNRGFAYSNLKLWDQAIADYTRTIEIDPKHTKAFYNRGIVYGNLNLWEKAISDYSAVIKSDPNHKQAFVNRGVAFTNLKQWNKAIDDYLSALKIDPSFLIATNNLSIARKNL